MTITAWTGDLRAIDTTFGYNDMLLTPGSGALPIGIRDRVSESDAAGVNPSAGLSDTVAEASALPGDHLYRLPNGGLLLRRPIFSDACPSGAVVDSNRLPVSENMTRALAFFSGYTADTGWCRANDANIAGAQITPWNTGSPDGLRQLEQAMTLLREVRAAGTDGDLPAEIPADRAALARDLATASAIPDEELTTLDTLISTEREAAESAGDMFMRNPTLHTLLIAIGFGVGTDIYHLARYLLVGGEPPLRGPFSLGGGVRTIIQGIRDFFNRRPPDDPTGGSAGTGGNTSASSSSGTSSSSVSRRTIEDQTFWGGVTALATAGAAWLGRSAIVQAGTAIIESAPAIMTGIETFLTTPVLPMPILIIMPDCESMDDPAMGMCAGSGPIA